VQCNALFPKSYVSENSKVPSESKNKILQNKCDCVRSCLCFQWKHLHVFTEI